MAGCSRGRARGRNKTEIAEGTVHSALAGVVRGGGEIEALYRRWFDAFPDLRFEQERPFVDGDRVALFWTIRGTHRGMFLGISATNQPLRFDHGSASD
jgi:predicted ester cyclase